MTWYTKQEAKDKINEYRKLGIKATMKNLGIVKSDSNYGKYIIVLGRYDQKPDSIDSFSNLGAGKYIITKIKNSKKHIKIGNKDILVS